MTITFSSIITALTKAVDILIVWLIFYYILKNIKNNVKLTLLFKGLLIMVVLKIASDVFNLTTIGETTDKEEVPTELVLNSDSEAPKEETKQPVVTPVKIDSSSIKSD